MVLWSHLESVVLSAKHCSLDHLESKTVKLTIEFKTHKKKLSIHVFNYRLMHSASESSGLTYMSSLIMNEIFQYQPCAVLKISSSLFVNEYR